MHHTTSAATQFTGAPPFSVTIRPSSRGRCALCLHPIYDGQAAVHVTDTGHRYPWQLGPKPVPYQHEECTE